MLSNWEDIDRFLTDRGVRIGKPTAEQTTGGRHASGNHHYSNHYIGTARDYGEHDSDAGAVAQTLEFIAVQPHGPIAELFCSVGSADIFIKNGERLSPVPLSLRAQHRNHCHVALKFGSHLF